VPLDVPVLLKMNIETRTRRVAEDPELADLPAWEGGLVYFVQAESGGPVKIGFTARQTMKDRLRGLQNGSPLPLCILATVRADKSIERALHSWFSSARLHGEWFTPTDEILALIEELA
jgi:hypothetical protein